MQSLFPGVLVSVALAIGFLDEFHSTTSDEGSQNGISVIYNSVDGGRTWTSFDNGIPDKATVSSFLVMDDRILAATDYHGIYSIQEGEKVWKRLDQDLPDNIDINAISAIGNSLVVGTLNHGVLISKNNGKNWTFSATQIANTHIRGFHKKGNILFAGADNGIFQSLDNGTTWIHIWKGVQVNGFAEVNDRIYVAVMNGALMSKDIGRSWNYIYKPHTLHDISINGESIYAMTLGDGLKRSDDGGLTWESVNNGLGASNLYTFEIKGYHNRIFAAQWDGIYMSDNTGKSWTLIKNGLPDSTAFTTLEVTKRGLIAGIGLRKE